MQFLIETPTSPPRSPRHLQYSHDYRSHLHQPLGASTTGMLPTTAGVAFGALPGQASNQPGTLSYGFGLGAASSLGFGQNSHSHSNSQPQPNPPTTQVGWGAGASTSTAGWGTMMTGHNHVLSPSPSSPLNSRRRRRSLSPDDDQTESHHNRDNTSPDRTTRQLRGLKKARVGGNAAAADSPGEGSGLVASLKEQQDLGKALASLDKDSLLNVMTNLLTSHPQLRPVVQSLLPPPTLSNTLTTLSTLERAVIAALPSGAHLREEYVWGRVRVPLEEYVSEAKTFLAAFTTTPPTSTGSSHSAGEDEIGHPATTFAFLHALTSSLRRLEVALPAVNSPPSTPGAHASWPSQATSGSGHNPLASHLLPLTLNSWHIFLTKLSTSVNTEGRIISAQMLRGWFTRLDELCVASPNVSGRKEGLAKRALEGVRERMRKEVGWLVGMREALAREPSVMDDEEEL